MAEGKPLRLLSLDGGGIRGLSILYILKGLMNHLEKTEDKSVPRPLLPCNYFDLIVGTSTGGLIAIMLGRLRMDIQTCINEYIRIGPIIFPEEGIIGKSAVTKIMKVAADKPRFKPALFEKAIQGVITKQLKPDNPEADGKEEMMVSRTMLENDGGTCRVALCATTSNPRAHKRFQTYESIRNVQADCKIWEACRATSAAPTFFPPMKIGRVEYLDGGLGYNNPIRACLDEARQIWGKTRSMGCIVSIGTGRMQMDDVGRGAAVLKTLKIIATDTEKVAQEFREEIMAEHGLEQKVYFRFNVQGGLENVGLEECSEGSLGRIETATQKYLGESWEQVQICARILLERTAAAIPSQSVSTLPSQPVRDPDFVGRKGVIDEIHKRFKTKTRVALWGFGGIGKTQVALHFIEHFRQNNPHAHLFWVYAGTMHSFLDSYKEIAKALSLPNWDDPKSNIPLIVRTHLESNKIGKWLMILDNSDDPKLFRGTQNSTDDVRPNISRYLPRTPVQDGRHGLLLITTRNRKIGLDLTSYSEPIKVNPLEPDDAARLLGLKIGPEASQNKLHVQDLIEFLNCTPLAITQAAAYLVHNQSCTVEDYLAMLKSGMAVMSEVLNEAYVDDSRAEDATNAVFQTWRVSYEHIRSQNDDAAKLMTLMSVLDARSILLKEERPTLEDRKAFQILRDYSLISEVKGFYSMHLLVQSSTQDWLESKNLLAKQKEDAVLLLAVRFPNLLYDYSNSALCELLLPQAQRVLTYNTDNHIARADLLPRVASSEMNLGQHLNSYEHYRECYQLRKMALGPFNRKTLSARLNMCICMLNLARLTEAEAELREVVKHGSRVFGPEDTITNHAQQMLAIFLARVGNYAAAEKIQRAVLATSERVHHDYHRRMLFVMHKLADILLEQGNYNEAEVIYKRLVVSYPEATKPGTFDALNTQHLLGKILNASGRASQAETVQREVLEKARTLCGETNQMVWQYILQLAWSLSCQQKYLEAEKLMVGVLKEQRRIYGNDHRQTLEVRYRLSHDLYNQNKYEEAYISARESLQGHEITLGKNHKHTLQLVKLLANVLCKLERYEESLFHFRQLAERSERSLRSDHIETIATWQMLAVSLCKMGQLDEGLEHTQRALKGRERILGNDHFETLLSLRVVVGTTFVLHRYEEGTFYSRELVKRSERSLGIDHIETVAAWQMLAIFLCNLGQLDEALEYTQRALKGNERVLGSDHPDTLISRGICNDLLREISARDGMANDPNEHVGTNETTSDLATSSSPLSPSSTPAIPHRTKPTATSESDSDSKPLGDEESAPR